MHQKLVSCQNELDDTKLKTEDLYADIAKLRNALNSKVSEYLKRYVRFLKRFGGDRCLSKSFVLFCLKLANIKYIMMFFLDMFVTKNAINVGNAHTFHLRMMFQAGLWNPSWKQFWVGLELDCVVLLTPQP